MNLATAMGSSLPVGFSHPLALVAPKTPKAPREKKPVTPLNPWALTPAEARLLDAVVLTGRVIIAAAKVGITIKTAEKHLVTVRRKMNGRTLIQACVEWDRWQRGAAV